MKKQTYNELLTRVEKLEKLINGGPGSGNFGHSGRPGKQGGSGSGQGSSKADPEVAEILEASFKKQYAKDYPDDYQASEIKEVSFKEIAKGLADGKDIDDIIGKVDPVVRDTAFIYLRDITGLDFEDFEGAWLGTKTPRFKEFETQYLK